jgi:integrase
MNLSDGIREYVSRKHANGFAFQHGEFYLLQFCRRLGDLPLSGVNALDVIQYLDSAVTCNTTWRLKYQIFNRFFEYWEYRGTMPRLVLPSPRPHVNQSFVPYIYSREELRTIFRGAGQTLPTIRRVSPQTLRTSLMLLYATGALTGEVVALRLGDVDFKRCLLTIGKHPRHVPFGSDLRDVLGRYIEWRKRSRLLCPTLFVMKADHPLSIDRFRKDFRKICHKVGVQRNDGVRLQPRLQDLRFTFAVHRITAWIRNGSDLNRMLPALAAYMGQAGLGATERYLSMTPERFRKSLSKLSPIRLKKHWRDDQKLMEFLAGLKDSSSSIQRFT